MASIKLIRLILLAIGLSLANGNQPPNIVLFVADDLGWGDFTIHGSKQVATPHLDALASDGILLNNYYVQSLCSPSRSALLTGMHPIHTGQQHFVMQAYERRGIPLQFMMLPEWLQNLGYKTAAIGKWHQGFYQKPYLPTERGFDSHFGYWASHTDYYDRTVIEYWWGVDIHRNKDPVDLNENFGKYGTELWAEEAARVLKNHSSKATGQPLFLYLAQQGVHVGNKYEPLQAPKKYIDRFSHIQDPERRTFAGMLAALDDAVGHLIKTLDESGMLNNTILFFTTDNGGAGGHGNHWIDDSRGSNYPLRGTKYTLWEGGIRGSAFIWAANLKKRYVSNHLMSVMDLMPTIYKAAGGNPDDLGSIDGIDYWDVLNDDKQAPRKQLLHNIDDIWKMYAVRYGNYKLVSGSYASGNFDGWYHPEEGREERDDGEYEINFNKTMKLLEKVSNKIGRRSLIKPVVVNCAQNATSCKPTEAPCLFDVVNDPCEKINLADAMPEMVKTMRALINQYNSTAVPSQNTGPDPKSRPAIHGYRWTVWD